MTRQKLPYGWVYNARGQAEEIDDPSHVVWIASVSKELASDHEDFDMASRIPIDLARALLRDSDPIYEAAKRVVATASNGKIRDEFLADLACHIGDLKRLIEESEEP